MLKGIVIAFVIIYLLTLFISVFIIKKKSKRLKEFRKFIKGKTNKLSNEIQNRMEDIDRLKTVVDNYESDKDELLRLYEKNHRLEREISELRNHGKVYKKHLKVIINKPATILIDKKTNEKYIVKTRKGKNGRRERFDEEKGVALALLRVLGIEYSDIKEIIKRSGYYDKQR